eukprot:9298068-Lingulodinium_polyedra.AAC.1
MEKKKKKDKKEKTEKKDTRTVHVYNYIIDVKKDRQLLVRLRKQGDWGQVCQIVVRDETDVDLA